MIMAADLVNEGLATVYASESVLLLIRLLCGSVFIYSAVTKTLSWNDSVSEFKSLGVPKLFIAPTIALQFFAGMALVLGFAVPLAALALAGFTFAATVLAHLPRPGQGSVKRVTALLEHLGIVGGLLALGALYSSA